MAIGAFDNVAAGVVVGVTDGVMHCVRVGTMHAAFPAIFRSRGPGQDATEPNTANDEAITRTAKCKINAPSLSSSLPSSSSSI